MKLVTLTSGKTKSEWVGIQIDGDNGLPKNFINIQSALNAMRPDQDLSSFSTILTFIENSDACLEAGYDVIERFLMGDLPEECIFEPSAVVYKSPIPVPPQIRDCLLFEEHLANAYRGLRETRANMEDDPKAALKHFEERGLYQIPDVWYELPLYYKANRFSVIGHNQDIKKPSYTKLLDFELEFGCFLKKQIKDVSEAEAKEAIFGYSILNDVSARDIQSREMQGQLGPAKGKDFDTGNIIGPCIVTADSFDPYNCDMIARINGVEVSRGHSSSISRSFEKVISYMSVDETLVPGEFIGSGTVGGGCGLEMGQFLEVGDVIELEVSGIGILRNQVV